jgi:hypothetical protein
MNIMQKTDNNKDIWIGAIVVLIIIAVVIFFSLRNKKEKIPVTLEQGTEDILPLPQPTPSTRKNINNVNNKTGESASLSYAEALVKYSDKRIQFDSSCHVPMPNITVTYKDNIGIMLDNRSASDHTIKVGTDYTIKAYGFKIIFLPDIYLKAKTILVDCDNQQNVATILVQE